MRRGTLPTGNFYTRRDFIDERKMSTLRDVPIKTLINGSFFILLKKLKVKAAIKCFSIFVLFLMKLTGRSIMIYIIQALEGKKNAF